MLPCAQILKENKFLDFPLFLQTKLNAYWHGLLRFYGFVHVMGCSDKRIVSLNSSFLCQYHSFTLSSSWGPFMNHFIYSINSLTQINTCYLLNCPKESVSENGDNSRWRMSKKHLILIIWRPPYKTIWRPPYNLIGGRHII